jgi:hypothetical protein
MGLAVLISEKSAVKISEMDADKAARSKAIKEKSALLLPIIDELNAALPDYGLQAYLHTDPSHLPCPAIHLGSTGSTGSTSVIIAVYDKIGEIILGSGDVAFHSGSCNRHIYSHSDKDALLNHVAETISECVASKRLVSK